MAFPTTHPALARALAARGYETPTAVQLAVLADNAAGRDQLVSAQTGSGKTVAFGLALAQSLLGEADKFAPTAAPLALIVAPTRELALQVCRELAWLYDATGARVITCVGGMDARAEARQLASGPHFVVGTPGRLRDHLERRRLNLADLRAVVLDEADEMLDLGFREDLEFILDATPAEKRTLLFSATMPRAIETLAARYQRDAVRIETGRRNEQHADIEYLAHGVVAHDAENAIVNVLRYHESPATLVFCATREAVKRLAARLLERGFSAVALSGELTQAERTNALQALRDGRARVLVATDVAARGLDLADLQLVIHAELPNDGETLLHRSGRTGRAGRKGLCVLIVPHNKRRKADSVIGSARLKVNWCPAPGPDEIRARDQERFLSDPGFTTAATEEEARLVRALQDAHPVEAIALALIRMHSAQLPAPEDLIADSGPPPRREWRARDGEERGDRGRKHGAPGGARGFVSREPRGEKPAHGERHSSPPARHSEARAPKARREDPRPMTWFRINIGSNRNADPRWLLPLICKAGGVTKSEIGAIRVEDRETRFEIVSEFADQFDYTTRTATNKEADIVRVRDGGSRDVGAVVDAIDAIARPAPKKLSPSAEQRPDQKRFKPRPRDGAPAEKTGWAAPRRDGKKAGSGGGHAPQRPGGGGGGPSRSPAKVANSTKKKKKY